MGEDAERGDACLELRSGRKVILAIPALLDASAAEAVGEHLLSAISHGARLVIIDMSATAIWDYAAVHSLIRACTLANEAGPEIRLVVVNHLVRRLLWIGGLGHPVGVYSSLPGAMTDLAPAPREPETPA